MKIIKVFLIGIFLLNNFIHAQILTNYFRRIEIKHEIIIVDVYPGQSNSTFKTWYHPWGRKIIKIYRKGELIREIELSGEQFIMIGEEAGYKMQIYSKQDPREELFDKPIIIPQTFDQNYGTEEQMKFGHMEGLLNTVYDLDGNKIWETGLLKTLYEEGYDIAVILFKNPLLGIEVNAKVFLEALEWLENKSEKKDGSEPIIIGPSMGGLISRKALQIAGKVAGGGPTYGNEDAIHAKLLIEFDSPNNGAYLPLSIQYFTKHFSSEDELSRSLYKNLLSIASQQMLLETVIFGTMDFYSEFYNGLNVEEERNYIKNLTNYGLGNCPCIEGCDIVPIRTIGITNGGSNGIGYSLEQNYRYALWRLSLPMVVMRFELRTPEKDKLVTLFNWVSYVLKWKWYIVPYLAWDEEQIDRFSAKTRVFTENAPGGGLDSYTQLKEGWAEEHQWEFFDEDYTDHCFIPTGSAAGLLEPYYNVRTNDHYYQIRPRIIEGDETLFDRVYLPISNQQHLLITSENKQWMLDEIHNAGLKCIDTYVSFLEEEDDSTENFSTITVPVRLEAPINKTVTVDFVFTGGTATPGEDFAIKPVSGQLIFDPNKIKPEEEIVLTIINDDEIELPETIEIELTNPVNVVLGDIVKFIYTIKDDDSISISFINPEDEGSEADTDVIIPVRLNKYSEEYITVDFKVSGTATHGFTFPLEEFEDFYIAPTDNKLVFLEGNISPHIELQLTINDDKRIESYETIIIELYNPSPGAVLGDVTKFTYTIIDNETVQRIYVDNSIEYGYDDGTSWQNAYRGSDALEKALDAAETIVTQENITEENFVQVWVAVGNEPYYPSEKLDPDDELSKTFLMRPYVSVYGGFLGNKPGGNEIDISQRDLNTNKTVLSGDIKNDDELVFDQNGFIHINNNGENLNTVVNVDKNVYNGILDGFTITGGNSVNEKGGGIHIFDVRVTTKFTIKNCEIIGNQALYGGGIGNFQAGETNIISCEISYNIAILEGGGINKDSYDQVKIINCLFHHNYAGENGGALIVTSLNTSLINCTIADNRSINKGGGIAGRFFSCGDNKVNLRNCILWCDSAYGAEEKIENEISEFEMPCKFDIKESDIKYSYGYPGEDNIITDPLFIDPFNENYQLQDNSFCIDEGDKIYFPSDIYGDLIGNIRLVDGDNDGEAQIDMGAYEKQ